MREISALGDLTGKTVIVRADLNVPLRNAEITDDGRVRAAVATIKELSRKAKRIVVISHLGRPKTAADIEFSLAPVAKRLAELLDQQVCFIPAVNGQEVTAELDANSQCQIFMLENLRFDPRETAKDAQSREQFATELVAATGAEAFVLDGFGVVHRQQASVTELAKALPSAAGLLVTAEVSVLKKLTTNTQRPYTVVLGGSKVSDKLGVIDHLLSKVDTLIIGGGMVFTFLAAKGYNVASSLLETEQIPTVKGYLDKAAAAGVEVILPTDIVVAEKFAPEAAYVTVSSAEIASSPFGESGIGLDIGPESANNFAAKIKSSATVFWNGPMGVFEMENFAAGTKAVAKALSEVTGLAVVGGGDSAAAVRRLGFNDCDFGHVSTGGGASLEFLEGKQLPGLEGLK